MTVELKKRVLAAGWIAAVALVASTGPPMPWLIVGVVGMGPAMVMLYLSRNQPLPIAERIQKARR